jgi:hypothetical protein
MIVKNFLCISLSSAAVKLAKFDTLIGSMTDVSTAIMTTREDTEEDVLRVSVLDPQQAVRENISGEYPDILEQQLAMDDRWSAYIPRVYEYEVTEYVPGIGTIVLGDVIHSGYQSTVFLATPVGSLYSSTYPYIIKYEWNCDSVGSLVHPLISDFKYGLEASKFGISSRPIFLSPPAIYEGRWTRKTQFSMPEDDRTACIKQGRANLRFLLVERLEYITLEEFRDTFDDKVLDIYTAMSVGIGLIQTLERLHAQNIVHGDIHSGNVLGKMGNARRVPDLKLIDFGRSFRSIENPDKCPIFPLFTHYSYWYTHWQMEGYCWGKRDDVYKAIQVIAMLMNDKDESWSFEEDLMNTDAIDLLDWKKYGFWFIVPGSARNSFDKLGEKVDGHVKFLMRENLEKILSLVRNLQIGDPIPYSQIVDSLYAVRLLTISSSMPTFD